MFTHVSGWAELEPGSRWHRVEALAVDAEAHGFTRLYVLDDFGRFAAEWSRQTGVRLAE